MIKLALRGDLRAAMARHDRAMEIAVSAVIKAKGRSVHKAVRKEVARGGFGRGISGAPLEKTIKVKNYPARGRSLGQAAQVYSVASAGRINNVRRREVDLIELFSRGETVNAAGGRFLAVPTESAPIKGGQGKGSGVRGGKRLASPTQADLPRGLTGIFRVKAGLYAIYDKNELRRSGKTVVLWWLVPNVTIKKRIDPYRPAPRLMRNAPELIGRRFRRESEKAAQRAQTRRRR